MAERKQEDHLMNADLNLNQYGDDSTPANQVAHPGGMNEKYTGEGTLNSNINYNKDLRTTDLDPEYKYGRDAQVANSQEAGYIARRNDNIASALYNEGLRSKDDVVQFLGSQKNWNNSTEADRFNTVESVWKRIGDIQEQEDKNNTEIGVKEMEEVKKEEPKGKDVNVNTFLQGTTTELFGKMITGADTAPYDHNSNEWKKAEARLQQYQKINALSIPQLASSIKAGSILSGGQAMRDLQTYNPEKYQQLQEYQQKEETMSQVNMIASGKSDDKGLNQKTGEAINNYLNESVANAGGGTLARMDLNTAISQNPGVTNYAERMSYYEGLINQIDDTINNLEEDIRKNLSNKLGENVYEYQIQNVINNRSKKLYKQRDSLKNQYNYYKGLYEDQVEKEATEWERKFKERQLELQEKKQAWDEKIAQEKFDWDKKVDQYNMDYKDSQSYSNIEGTGQGTMRTERNNNPTAMTIDVAKTLGMIEGVDYVKGDAFKTGDGKVLYTAKILGDPIETTIKAFDNAVDKGINVFYTQSGKQRWNHTAMSNDQWKSLSKAQKRAVIMNMLKNEGGDISKFTYYNDGSNTKNTTTTMKKTTTSTTKTSEKTYTNDELYTQLRGGKIDHKKFLSQWNGDEPQEEVDDRVAKKYFEEKPMMHLSDMKDSVNNLNKMLGDEELAELYTLEHLNQNKNIKNENIVKIVTKYVDDVTTNKGRDISISDYLAMVLSGRVNNKNEVKKLLDSSGIDFKELTGEKTKKVAIAIWEKINGGK